LAQWREQIESRQLFIVSESGIQNPDDVANVQKSGAQGILVGESLMRQDDLGKAIAALYA